MEATAVAWEAAVERQSDALARILIALAAMAGLLAVARGRLPRSVYRAVLRPLLAAQAAALPFSDAIPLSPTGRLEIRAEEEALLRRRFAALARAIADLIRRLPTPRPGGHLEFRPKRLVDSILLDLQFSATGALAPDTS